jgi:hypothetical protein
MSPVAQIRTISVEPARVASKMFKASGVFQAGREELQVERKQDDYDVVRKPIVYL